MSGGPSSKPPLLPLPPRPPKPRPPGDLPPNPRPPPPNPLPAGGLMVLCVGCGSCVSLFGERERAAKRPGRREACERARRCARRTRGEGKRSTDVCESSGRAAVRAAGIGIRAPPGDFSQARTRSRLAARAQISARTRSARRVPTVDRPSSCHTPPVEQHRSNTRVDASPTSRAPRPIG